MTSYFLENSDAMHQLDIESKAKDKLFDQELSVKLAREEVQAVVKATENGAPASDEVLAEVAEAESEEEVHEALEEEPAPKVDDAKVKEMFAALQEKCRERKFPSDEWEHMASIGELQDYMTSKASGGYDSE
jgi:hypothetical protein